MHPYMVEALDINIAPGTDAPSHARSLVAGFTRGRLPRAVCENAVLLVSELASNAVVHALAPEPMRLQLSLRGECLHVDVTDGGPCFNPPAHPQPREDGGFGLYLLDRAADRWGVARGEGCRVWFELDRAVTTGPRALRPSADSSGDSA